MRLTVYASTKIPDLTIDYIQVILKDGRDVSLNWDTSGIDRDDGGFSAIYRGVYFDEEYANGKILELEGMKIDTIGLFSEELTDEQMKDAGGLKIDSMEFEDGESPLLEFDDVPFDNIDWTM